VKKKEFTKNKKNLLPLELARQRDNKDIVELFETEHKKEVMFDLIHLTQKLSLN